MTNRVRLGILISGRGSNMEALLAAAADPSFPARPVVVIANRADAAGLGIAAAAGLPALCISHRDFADRAGFEDELDRQLRAHGVELVALAGFMRILTDRFIDRWPDRILNIHPSLLPLYRGLDTHGRALSAGDREAGCTVHLVTAALDDGPILGQARVPVEPGDTAETLAARVLAVEHRLYPQALADYARSRAWDHAPAGARDRPALPAAGLPSPAGLGTLRPDGAREG
jgi:formyltetrahydrofolate-dependent phosphoribosylglycinamide formyltransferase